MPASAKRSFRYSTLITQHCSAVDLGRASHRHRTRCEQNAQIHNGSVAAESDSGAPPRPPSL
eukprot:15308923-Alexandrium_andersonii.AAC.1